MTDKLAVIRPISKREPFQSPWNTSIGVTKSLNHNNELIVLITIISGAWSGLCPASDARRIQNAKAADNKSPAYDNHKTIKFSVLSAGKFPCHMRPEVRRLIYRQRNRTSGTLPYATVNLRDRSPAFLLPGSACLNPKNRTDKQAASI